MSSTVTPYKTKSVNKKKQVETMFDNIAHRYDFLNHFLSLGIDIRWRKKAIKLLQENQPEKILDVATGTGDFALAALKLNAKEIIGIDLSEKMLDGAREKIRKKNIGQIISVQQGDSENLPFETNYFDAITVGFGVRNFENLEQGLSEMSRVLKPQGQAVILEFSRPKKVPMKQLYNFYFKKMLPAIGALFSKDKHAYTYLPESVEAFPDGTAFEKILKNTGFAHTKKVPLTFGIATIYVATKAK